MHGRIGGSGTIKGMNSPEWNAAKNIDRKRSSHEELSPLMKRAHEKATKEVLTNPEITIQEQDFKSVYGNDAVERDIALANKYQKIFEAQDSEKGANMHKIAEVFESIVLMQSEMSNWLGNAHTLKTSRFDDYVNKVDMLAEWKHPEQGSHLLALAVDVTFASRTAEKKISAIKAEIDKGELGAVRYFRDVDGNFKGTRYNVPRVVIGVSEPLVTELAHLWVNDEKKALGVHPVQKLLVNEIDFQLQHMRSYAMRIGNVGAVNAFDQTIATIRKIKDNQKSFVLNEQMTEDPVWKSIAEQTKANFKE